MSRRYPWRYQLGSDGYRYAPLIENWLAERGIDYRIRTERDIPQRQIENILMLEDYLHPPAPPCPVDVAQRIHDALNDEAVLYLLSGAFTKPDCRPDDVFKLIADGLLVSDIDVAPLEEPQQQAGVPRYRGSRVRIRRLRPVSGNPFRGACSFGLAPGSFMTNNLTRSS